MISLSSSKKICKKKTTNNANKTDPTKKNSKFLPGEKCWPPRPTRQCFVYKIFIEV
jgi:hypothetical protein